VILGVETRDWAMDDRGPRSAVSVIYVAGVNRSGSTLLSYLLGSLPGIVAAGELKGIWRGGLIDDELCGCGVSFSKCDFWQTVGAVAFGGWSKVDSERVDRLAVTASARRSVVALSHREAVVEYRVILGDLYRAIATVAEADIVVDATKSPVNGLVAFGAPGVDLSIAHLVRDSRGVAYSMAKRDMKDPGKPRGQSMPVRHPARSAVRWAYNSVFIDTFALAGVRREIITYEALVADPTRAVSRLLMSLNAQPDSLTPAPVSFGDIRLERQHTIRGNPSRFEAGIRPIKADRDWETQLSLSDRLLVTAITGPLLLRYGYFGKRQRRAPRNGEAHRPRLPRTRRRWHWFRGA
jgi:hypothetical protein